MKVQKLKFLTPGEPITHLLCRQLFTLVIDLWEIQSKLLKYLLVTLFGSGSE